VNVRCSFSSTSDSNSHTVKGAQSREHLKWFTRNVAEHLWPSFKLSEFI